jgi:hypothetical protein
MKIRTGFVSNSSSSSFVFVGLWAPREIPLQEDIEQIELFLEDEYYSHLKIDYANSENGLPNNCLTLGCIWFYKADEGEVKHISEEVVQNILAKAREAWMRLFPDDIPETQHSGVYAGSAWS